MGDQTDELQEHFIKCDQNGDGRIQFDEFATLLSNLGAQTSSEENRLGFEAVDTDQDGAISFDEFVAWFSEA